MIDRLLLTVVNISFPPLAVFLITGPSTDTLINCCLFICAIIPSHIHGFYITCTYFHRKHKVRKGKYPGGPKCLIFDTKVCNGGASDWEVDELWDRQEAAKREKRRRRKDRNGVFSRRGSLRGSQADKRGQGYRVEGDRTSGRRGRGSKMNDGLNGRRNDCR